MTALDFGGIVREWSPLFGLVMLGWLMRRVVSGVYQRVRTRVDQKLPDNLPMGAGAWLDEAVRERFMDLRVLVATTDDKDIDAYFPSARTVLLSQEVFYKRDASFWAVAAHELGHARVYQMNIVLHALLLGARLLVRACTGTATMLILANVLYGMPEIDRLAFTLLLMSLGGYVVVLLDEATASTLAIHMLARDPRVDRAGLFGAVTALTAAFMTYMGGFVGQLLLVGQRDFVIAKLEMKRHFVAGLPAGDSRLALVAVLSVVLATLALRDIVYELRRPKVATSKEASKRKLASFGYNLLRGLAACALVGLLWDQPLGPFFAVACVAAILASRPLVAIVIGIAAGLVWVAVFLVAVLVALVIGKAIMLYAMWDPESSVARPANSVREIPKQPVDAAEIARTERATEEMAVETFNRPPWWAWASRVGYAALHLAFVIALWAKIVAH